MSRNAAGTYSKPAGQPVTANSTISSATHNTLVDDIATELTDSLSRSGKGGMSAVLGVVDAGVRFNDETTTGLYRAGAGDARVKILGTDRVQVTAAGVDVTGEVAATGAVSGTTGTFSSHVAGVNGTFSGDVSGVAGTFSGAVSGTTGTFSAGLGDDTSHGNRGGGALHADVVAGGAAGFMTGADKTKLDAATDAATAETLMLRDAAGAVKVATPTDPAHAATKGYVDGSQWAIVSLAATLTSNSTSLVDVSGLAFSCATTTRYRVRGHLYVSNSGTEDFVVAAKAAGAPTASLIHLVSHFIGSPPEAPVAVTWGGEMSTSTLNANTLVGVDFDGLFVTTGVGTFQLQVRRSAGAGNFNVYAGSYLEYQAA